jgi:formyl-CoA transferase
MSKGNAVAKALEGVRVLDMTHVQSGPSCTQILAWLGADVVKLEAPGGDITRKQLRDIPGVDSLYFTMLNCNKRSITLNMKSAEGKRIFTDLLPRFDILAENFAPGAIERMGFGGTRCRRSIRDSSSPPSRVSATAPIPITRPTRWSPRPWADR